MQLYCEQLALVMPIYATVFVINSPSPPLVPTLTINEAHPTTHSPRLGLRPADKALGNNLY